MQGPVQGIAANDDESDNDDVDTKDPQDIDDKENLFKLEEQEEHLE